MQTVFRLVLGQDHSWPLAADLSLQQLSRWPTGHTCVLTADSHDLTYPLFSQIGVLFANRLVYTRVIDQVRWAENCYGL